MVVAETVTVEVSVTVEAPQVALEELALEVLLDFAGPHPALVEVLLVFAPSTVAEEVVELLQSPH